ncbi:hypothetical protein PIB30_058537 [Stylosanthes scabra]|uniref:Uncharacterized protein n=1 Tax=Stylosanthes scabra TaxID=79078 RepID=A0ABU6RK53_9FABA|nr:hypothetical protein [Stylosanthes scabra]
MGPLSLILFEVRAVKLSIQAQIAIEANDHDIENPNPSPDVSDASIDVREVRVRACVRRAAVTLSACVIGGEGFFCVKTPGYVTYNS